MQATSILAPLSCAWCTRTIREGNIAAGSTFGICLTCLGDSFSRPVENLATLDHEAADQLPFGFIRMDAEGHIIGYNTRESALSGLPRTGVLGKNFFRTIAPCTCVEEFEGTLKTMMASGRAQRCQIEFLFKFNDRATMVNIAMTSDPETGYATLLIRKLGDSS
jgi:photoactive yellow protein